jgi:hypothetical protein
LGVPEAGNSNNPPDGLLLRFSLSVTHARSHAETPSIGEIA